MVFWIEKRVQKSWDVTLTVMKSLAYDINRGHADVKRLLSMQCAHVQLRLGNLGTWTKIMVHTYGMKNGTDHGVWLPASMKLRYGTSTKCRSKANPWISIAFHAGLCEFPGVQW